jgi:hypothetical protein
MIDSILCRRRKGKMIMKNKQKVLKALNEIAGSELSKHRHEWVIEKHEDYKVHLQCRLCEKKKIVKSSIKERSRPAPTGREGG